MKTKMRNTDLIPIESKSGVTIYGRIVDNMGKLGQFEVHSDFSKSGENIYSLYKEAQTKMSAMIGVKSSQQ